MSAATKPFLKLYATINLFRGVLTGTNLSYFAVAEGSRLVFSLYVKSIDPGATVIVHIRNTFDQSLPYNNRITITTESLGYTMRALSDFHNQFEVEIEVQNGSAEISLGVTCADNALSGGGGGGGDGQTSTLKEDIECSDDVLKKFTWSEIDGVQRIVMIEFTSESVNADSGLTLKLVRTFSYLAVDPFTLDEVQDTLVS